MQQQGYAFTEPAPGISFVEGPASNWVILRAGERFTLVDAGYRGDLPWSWTPSARQVWTPPPPSPSW